ncbi:Protein OS-9 [Xanthoria calcicola]
MIASVLWLAFATAISASSSVFSVHDDLLAFPQYEVVFSDTFILDHQASLRLHSAVSSSSSTRPHDSSSDSKDTSAELAKHTSSKTQDASTSPSESPNSYESMKLNGRSYLCAIPTFSIAPNNDTTKAKDKAEEAAELARATDRGWELLKEMEGNCMYFISGWWSYSFCYNTDVKQFHQLPPGKGAPMYPPMQDPSTPAYVLGRFEQNHHPPSDTQNEDRKPNPRIDAPNNKDPSNSPSHRTTPSTTQLRAKGDLRYLVQTLSGGTICDLTGRPRKIEVQFHCHPQSADRIGWIKEVSTCSYLMVIYTPRLCHDVAFLPPRENKAAPIACQEILASASDIPEWRQRKQNEAERKLVAASSSGRPIVGSIEVGGMKLVGKEGQRIETPPSTAFNMRNGDGKDDVKAETLAAQDSAEDGGKMTVKVGDDALRKMGLDPGVVEGARRELSEVAGGKGWKLEVFEVGDGVRELRGIVEGDEDLAGEDQGEDGGEREDGSEEVYKDEL